MPLFALTPELVASIQAQYPSLATLNLAGNGARGERRRCAPLEPLRAALARFEHRQARCGRFALASDARARAMATYTELQSLEHLAPLSGSLTALDASDNALRCAAGCASLPLLTEADLRHNALDDLAALVTALRPLRRLRALALAGNPLCSAFSSAHAYRAAVAAALPQLRDLDGVALPRGDAAAQGERAGAAEDAEEEHGAPRDAELWRQWRMPRGPRPASPQRARGAASPEPTGGDEAGWARDEAAADEREAAHSAAVATALLRAQLAAARREAQENAARAEAAEAAAATAEEVTARTEAALQVRPSCALAMTCRAHAARHRAERARCGVGCRCASCRCGSCSGQRARNGVGWRRLCSCQGDHCGCCAERRARRRCCRRGARARCGERRSGRHDAWRCRRSERCSSAAPCGGAGGGHLVRRRRAGRAPRCRRRRAAAGQVARGGVSQHGGCSVVCRDGCVGAAPRG